MIGPSWGAQITRQALIGLGFFIVAVGFFLVLIYEWKMAAAALVALVHDIVATIGIYALIGFDVTPATVIGFLTILGYSLYDTVVIFDKVRENTKGITAQNQYTYAEAANLGLNQTLMRSINTVIIALLPIGSILFVGAGLLGAGTLKDLSLALFVGVAIGTYSSIFIATPLLVDLKNREPTLAALARRVEARRAAKVPRGDGTEDAVPTATVAAPSRGAQVTESGERRQPQRQTRSQRRRQRGAAITSSDERSRRGRSALRRRAGGAALANPRHTGLARTRSGVQGHHPLLDHAAFASMVSAPRPVATRPVPSPWTPSSASRPVGSFSLRR